MKFLFSLLCLACVAHVSGQNVPQTPYALPTDAPAWMRMMYSDTVPVPTVEAAYDAWYAEHPFVKTAHTQYFKRWRRAAHQIVDRHDRDFAERYAASQGARDNGQWTELGPWHYDPEVAMYFEVQSPGACHVYTVEQSASAPDVVWAGTATAGAWKSTDKGLHWDLMTRALPINSVYSVAIDPTNPDRVWIGEGDGGLWRTEDGGTTWQQLGNTPFMNADRWYRELYIDPTGRLWCATNDGLWYSDDNGETLLVAATGEFMEIVAHPTDSLILYTLRRSGDFTNFLRSTDGGESFATAGTGLPMNTPGHAQRRSELAVTPADPDRVVVLAAGSTSDGGGLYGYYISTDAGLTFEQQCCGDAPGGPYAADTNPNLLGWSEDGSGEGGQFYYDLALDVSPTDADRQFGAGINVWRTENGGTSWSLNAHWVTWAGEFTHDRYTHADVHDVAFFTRPDGTVDLWVASDGGLHYSADQGDHFEPRMYGIHGTDFWGWQSGWRASEVMVGGTYHNGTLIRNGDLYHYGADSDTAGGWLAELAGDNYRGFVHPADGTRGFHDGGAFAYSDDRFTRISSRPFDGTKKPNTGYGYGDYGNLEWDPRCAECFYSPVGSGLWRTEDGGAGWGLVHDFGGDKIISIAIPPRHPEHLYVSHKFSGSSWRIHHSADGGATWTNISLNTIENGGNSNKPIYLEVDEVNPLRVWAVLVGGQTGNKVFESTDGGENWTDRTTSTIAGERVVSIAHQRGVPGALYIGTTRTVYYIDDSLSDWQLYADQLPASTAAVFLQPNYCGGTLRAAGNRSVHEAAFHTPSAVQAGFMADRLQVNLASPCDLEPVRFADVSVAPCEGTTYAWSFPGGSPATASTPDVSVVYDALGAYDVTLTVTDSAGNSDTWTWPALIEVVDEPVVTGNLEEDFDGELFPPEHWRMEIAGRAWEHAWDLVEPTNGVAQFPNYWVDTQGAEDALITPGFDPTGMEVVRFDVAHRKYADYVDGLEVWVKPGGAASWLPIWEAYGEELSVPDCYTWFWYDTGGEVAWATHEVPLPEGLTSGGVACLEVAFVNVGGYGNHIWLDNVFVGSAGPNPVTEHTPESVQLAPNPATETVHCFVPESLLGEAYALRDATGRIVREGRWQASRQVVELGGLAPGMYLLTQATGPAQRLVIQ